ncbi:MAG: VWA domain-containing protein [Saprospiraceae bacterium]
MKNNSSTDKQDLERIRKWRMILGQSSDPQDSIELEGEEMQGMDDALDALYDSDRQGGLGSSSPNVNRWLGDIRKYFPTSTVQIMQKDALERLDLERLLLEPELLEAIEPDVGLVGTLISLNKVMPQKTRETARTVVQKIVKELEQRLKSPFQEAIKGSLNRAVVNRRPKSNEIDWHRTIRANLKNYQPELQAIIPEILRGYGKKGQSLKHVILLLDQSGSMATSIVYASILGAIMASLRSLKTHLVVFDTSVVDLTAKIEDPVDLLFSTQLGGGTDIGKALNYAQTLVEQPRDTIVVLISDLFEGGNERQMLKKVSQLKNSGLQFISLLALNDQGAPIYDKGVAAKFASLDIPTFSCTPDKFADLMAAAIKREDIRQWLAKERIVVKG